MKKSAVWAHRGARLTEAENTLEAFTLALDLGADGLELDVQLSADGIPVVTHDEKLTRVAGVRRKVEELSLKELRELNMAAYRPSLGLRRIPLLEEVLELIRSRGCTLNIELKNSIVPYEGMEEKVLELVRRAGVEDLILYSGFNHDSMKKMASLAGKEKCALLYEYPLKDPLMRAAQYDACALHPAESLADDGLFDRAHAAGLAVNVWTVNSPEGITRLLKLGADAIITDDPALALRLRDEAQDL